VKAVALSHVVGYRYCWRAATATMCCHTYNALWTGNPAALAQNLGRPYWFEASWTRRWWGGIRVELCEWRRIADPRRELHPEEALV
jgi:hypothetical protein